VFAVGITTISILTTISTGRTRKNILRDLRTVRETISSYNHQKRKQK